MKPQYAVRALYKDGTVISWAYFVLLCDAVRFAHDNAGLIGVPFWIASPELERDYLKDA